MAVVTEAGDGGAPCEGVAGPGAERRAFAQWPVPVGRVEERGGLAFVYSSAPGGYSAEDYRRIPAGEHVELIDGVAVVRPEPGPAHRDLLGRLHRVLDGACPAGLAVFTGPLDVPVDASTVFVADLVVLRESGGPPALVVDALGDHGRPRHGGVTFRGYRRARVAAYWVLDPGTATLTAYRRDERTGYRRVAEFTGDDVCALDRPFPVRFRVGDVLLPCS